MLEGDKQPEFCWNFVAPLIRPQPADSGCGRIVGKQEVACCFLFARNPTRIDGKCGDHFLQADSLPNLLCFTLIRAGDDNTAVNSPSACLFKAKARVSRQQCEVLLL